MGCGMSTEDKEGKARNEEIENQLKRDKMMQRNEIKMLLLGMLPSSRFSFSTSPFPLMSLNRSW
jgi:guanine nucleotide-binding protein subunit alpha